MKKKLKIYLNRKPKKGPWGGGNKTISALAEALKKEEHEVFFDFNRPDFDVIFCIDPRPDHTGVWYQHFLNYKNQFGAKIIQRVGDLGTHGKPELFQLIQQCLKYSDYFIFPSSWAKEKSQIQTNNFSVIPNRPRSIFHEFKKDKKLNAQKIKIVTHHWSNNPKKGFDTYRFIDEHLSEKYDFTYIGRVPEGFHYKNSNYIEPIEDHDIGRIVSQNDVYLTASKEEAGANHVLEGLACGLPTVYHDQGGSINEYVGDMGVSFSTNDELEKSIEEIVKEFPLYKNKCLNYNETIEQTIKEYSDLLCQI
jgi:glycosyltransferase involved in cell wall biosynthesis